MSPASYFPCEHPGNDVVEGHDFGGDVGREQLERQVGGGQRSGHRDGAAADLIEGDVARGDDHRPVTLAHAAAARHQRILVLEIGIGVERDRRDVVEAVHGFAVQGLDVAKRVSELHPGHANLVGRHAVEHEGVIGVGTMSDGDFADVLGAVAGHRNQFSRMNSRSLDSD